MTCPGTYPTVLNGVISYNDSSTAEYGCLTGFYMTGNKRITCSAGVWQTTPTCHVIDQADDVFPDWWLIVAAAVLCVLVLVCSICVLCYFCCGRGVAENAVHPVTGRGRAHGCCGDRGCGGCRNGCCGRENGCCSCTQGCCRAGGGCCASTAGCCLLGASGGCCCCCRQDGNARGKKRRGRAAAGNTGKGKGAAGEGSDVITQPPTSVVTSPPKNHAAVLHSQAKTTTALRTDKKGKTPPPETTPPGGHYIFIPANDDDVNATSHAHHPPKTHGHAHSVHRSNVDHSVGHAHHLHRSSMHPVDHSGGHAYNHRHSVPADAHGHHGHAHSHPGHAYMVHSPPLSVAESGQATPCSCCGPSGGEGGRGGWILVQDAMASDRLHRSDDLQMEVLETRSDGDVGQQRPVKTKKLPAKEVKGWLPHSHPVRTINTSTK